MISIHLNADSTEKIVYPKDSIKIPNATINDNLQHQETECSFSFPYDSEIHSFILDNDIINAIVYENDTPLFTGIINTEISWKDNGRPEPIDEIPLSIKDNTYLLDNNTQDEVALINSTLADVIQKICTDCNVTIADNSLPQTSLEAFVLDKDSSYLSALNNLLFEYGYAFYFNELGYLKLINLTSSITNPQTLTEADIYTGLSWNRTNKKYTSVKVTYGTLTKKENEQVYFEGNGLNEDHEITPIVLRPSQYYPYNSDPVEEARSGQVYQSFNNGYAESYRLYSGEKKYRRTEKTTLIYTENQSVVEDWEGSIQINRTQFGARQASVRLLNTGTSDANLYQFAIRADAYYRNTESTLILGEGSSFEYQTEYIYTEEAAQSFAELLSRFFVSGNYKITGYIAAACKAGDCFSIDTGISGVTANAIVIASEFIPEEEKYYVTMLTFGDVKVVVGRYTVKSAFSRQAKDGANAIVMTSASTPAGSYVGQIGLWQSQLYRWNGTSWENTSAILPTDAVLHYSFDEVPDIPDGTSIYKHDNDFVTSEWSGNATVTVSDGKLTISGTGGQYKYHTINIPSGNIIRVKGKANSDCYIRLTVRHSGASSDTQLAYRQFNSGEKFDIAVICDATSININFFDTRDFDITLDSIYIGNGSYNTPIIDNANGQYHATNNGELATEGVSGKAVKLLANANKYLNLTNAYNNLTDDFTFSIWVNPENNTGGLNGGIYGGTSNLILRNGATWGDYLMAYIYLDEGGGHSTQISGGIQAELLPANKWSHIVLVKNGTSLFAYVDGVLKHTYSLPTSKLYRSGTPFYLGRDISAITRSQSLDDFQIYNRALSEEEVLGLYLSKGNTPKFYNLRDYQLESIDDDGVISPFEKQTLLTEWKRIYNAVNVTASMPTTSPITYGGEYKGVIDEANNLNILNVTEIQSYITATNELRSALWNVTNGYLLNVQTQSDVRSDINLDVIFANYRTALQNARTKITDKQASTSAGLSIITTNEFMQFPQNESGVVTSYDNSGNTIQVYSGTTALTPSSSTVTSSSPDNTFSITASGTHITAGSFSYDTTNKKATIGNSSAFSQSYESAEITYTIKCKVNGVVFTTYASQKCVKASRGADARNYSFVFNSETYVVSEGTVTPSTITCKAYSWTGSATPALFGEGTIVAKDANGNEIGRANGNTLSVNVSSSYGNITFTLYKIVSGSTTTTILEQETVNKLENIKGDKGDTGISVGNQILRGTNTTFTELVPSSSSTWANKKWRKASTATDNRTVIDITDCPDPNIVKGVNILGGNTSVDHISQDAVPLLSGVEYTMSCWAKADSLTHTPKVNCQWWKDSSHSGSTNINLTTEWKKYSFTFTPNVDTPNIYFGGRYASTDTTTNIKICGMKVELGNTATDWCEYEYDKNGKKIKISDYPLRTWSADNWTSYSTAGNTANWTNTDHDFAVGDILIVPAKLSSEGNIIGQSYNEVTGTPYQDGSYWRIPCKVLYGVKGEKGQTGDKGDTGATGATGARGATWYQGNKITGWNTTGTVFSSSGITSAIVGDQYLNTDTQDIYTCTLAGNASTAKWAYVGNLTKDESTDTLRFDAWKGTNTVYKGTAITGTSTTATIFSGSGITNALVDDLYINTSTDNVYKCTVGGSASVAKWVFTSLAYANTIDDGPFGKQTIMKTYRRTGNTTQYGAARTVNYSKTPIDVNKRYRFSIFWKPVVTVSGVNNYFGVGVQNNTNYVASLGSSSGSTNAYMFSSTGTSLNPNRWYLIVASVHPSDYTSTVMDSETGVYDALTGEKVASATDFKWMPNCPSVYTRQLFNYIGDTTGRKAEHWFTMPRMDLCNGLQPSLADLLKGNSHTTEWYSGSAITGTSTTATVFSSSGITYAVKGDKYINTDSASASYNNVYECVKGGIPSIATWKYTQNIKGDKGDRGFSSRTIAFRANHSAFGTAEKGEVYVCGYNANGAESDTAGYVIVDGTTYYAKGMVNTNIACDGYLVVPTTSTSSSSPSIPRVAYLSNIGSNMWYVLKNGQTSNYAENITDANLGNWIVIGKMYMDSEEGNTQVEPVTPCKLSTVTQPFNYYFEGIVSTLNATVNNVSNSLYHAKITPYKIVQNSSTSYSVSALTDRYARRGAVVLQITNLTSTPSTATIYFFNGTYWNTISNSDSRYYDVISLMAGSLPVIAGYYVSKGQSVPSVCGTYIETLTSNMAIINRLFVNKIKVGTNGSIYGGDRYDKDGNLTDPSKLGFYLGADGNMVGLLGCALTDNVLIGDGAGESMVKNTATSEGDLVDRNNVYIGVNAGDTHGYELAKNNYNVGVGYFACAGGQGSGCVAIGRYAVARNLNDYIVGIGYYACTGNTGVSSVGIGYRSLLYNSGNDVVAIGYNAGGAGIDEALELHYQRGSRVCLIGRDVGAGNNQDDYISIMDFLVCKHFPSTATQADVYAFMKRRCRNDTWFTCLGNYTSEIHNIHVMSSSIQFRNADNDIIFTTTNTTTKLTHDLNIMFLTNSYRYGVN